MPHPGQDIRLKGSARTNTGKVRDNNEDSVHLWTDDGQVALAVVADGMGGAVAGEEASRIAIEAIQDGLMKLGDFYKSNGADDPLFQDELADYLKDAIQTANLDIVNQASERPELKGMGTTVTLAFVYETHVVVGHVGDSRAYVIKGHDGHIEQITSDHSFVQALVAAGHITEDEAEDHPMRNVLYRALGQAHDVEIDLYYKQLAVGDRLVLCSDGLTLHLKPHEIAQLALSQDEPSLSSQEMIDLANQRGGRDNVSVVIVKVERYSQTQQIFTEIETEPAPDDDDTMVLKQHLSPEFKKPPPESTTNLMFKTARDQERGAEPRINSDDYDGEGQDPASEQ